MTETAVGPDPALSRVVSGDLEQIFQTAALPRGSAASKSGARVRSIGAAPADRRERRPAHVGALAATALVGLALGAAIARPGLAEREPRAAAWTETRSEPVQLARIDVPPVTPPPTVGPAMPAPAPAVTPEPVRAVAGGPAATKAVAKAPARKSQVRKASAATSRRSSGGYACNGLTRSAEARCAYPAVMDADRSLRAAYGRAVRAGVPRSTLVNFRSRWASLRHRADDQPAKVIYGYRSMARDLDRLSGART